jgi:hypothetical protein
MSERRENPRLLCADLVKVAWRDSSGRIQREHANLEDISLAGACLQVDRSIPANTEVRITHENGELKGSVRYCVFREIGFFVGVQFEPGTKWSPRQFRPMHLLDPRRLATKQAARGRERVAV